MNVDSYSLNHISLCSGYGGFDLGLRGVFKNFRTICYVEREAYAAAVLARRMEEGRICKAPIWSDLTTFDAKKMCGLVDIVSAGFPCQDVSMAGNQVGIEGKRSSLFREVLRIYRECGANLLILENVSAIIRCGFETVIKEIALLGLDAKWGCYKASEVGASHHRERIFVLAYPRSLGWASIESVSSASKLQFFTNKHIYPPMVRERQCERNKPAIQRVVNGDSDGMDGSMCLHFQGERLQLCGNGIVPEQAERAIRHMIFND